MAEKGFHTTVTHSVLPWAAEDPPWYHRRLAATGASLSCGGGRCSQRKMATVWRLQRNLWS